MILKFDEIPVSVLPQFKGGEKELAANMFFDGTNRIFKGRLAPGASIGMHTHEDSCEVIFIISGNGTITEIDPANGSQTKTPVSGGDCLYCPEGHTHSLINTGTEEDLVFHAVVAAR